MILRNPRNAVRSNKHVYPVVDLLVSRQFVQSASEIHKDGWYFKIINKFDDLLLL